MRFLADRNLYKSNSILLFVRFSEIILNCHCHWWAISRRFDINYQALFFNSFFNLLAGTDKLAEQIMAGKSEEQIRASWAPGLYQFKQVRSKYLLYLWGPKTGNWGSGTGNRGMESMVSELHPPEHLCTFYLSLSHATTRPLEVHFSISHRKSHYPFWRGIGPKNTVCHSCIRG